MSLNIHTLDFHLSLCDGPLPGPDPVMLSPGGGGGGALKAGLKPSGLGRKGGGEYERGVELTHFVIYINFLWQVYFILFYITESIRDLNKNAWKGLDS